MSEADSIQMMRDTIACYHETRNVRVGLAITLLESLLAKYDALQADRDEWKQQHENLLACLNQANQTITTLQGVVIGDGNSVVMDFKQGGGERMIDNLIELIAKLDFGVTIERAEDCALMEQIIGAEICGRYNRFLPANTIHVKTATEDYIVMLKDGKPARMDLPPLDLGFTRKRRTQYPDTPW